MTIRINRDHEPADLSAHRGRRKPGGKRVYSDVAIETFWMISMIYGLALRQAEGFIESLFELAGVCLPVSDRSTVSRRVGKLGKVPLMPRGSSGPIHRWVDSTGGKPRLHRPTEGDRSGRRLAARVQRGKKQLA